MIKKLMMVFPFVWFAGAVGVEDFDNDLKNYVSIHQEGNKEPDLLELHKDKTPVAELKKTWLIPAEKALYLLKNFKKSNDSIENHLHLINVLLILKIFLFLINSLLIYRF